jgi:polyisoprenoid-binding protein YceI
LSSPRWSDVSTPCRANFAYDAADPAKSSVSVEVDVNSVNTNYAERDNHIRSAEILNAVGIGKANFKSESIKIVDERNAKISGKLNILGADHDIVVKAKHVGGGDDPWGGFRQGFTGEAQLSLKELGVPMNLGPASDAVTLVVQLEGIRQ